ncbi:NAD(P)-binding protein [Lophiostoma macrostomum CBS 122681]|uniref:NAD(P)-binding protein n=1 Tax=Lophiostoma macrostomum CBS 122681 TaxID=1314788 RepID=A0A6A6TD61_9PLEO|nr:NAD(P)-binding protein [Lophiostoma macrostomum CBS 122681]
MLRDVPDFLSPERPFAQSAAKGKIIVITGGGTGVGLGIARYWIAAGAAGVVISGRRKDKIDSSVISLEELAAGKTKILGVQADVAKEADTDALFAAVKKAFGRAADVVFANAGNVSEVMPLHKDANANWWKVFEVNILGTHNTAMSWIRSQENPDDPVGTFLATNTDASGLVTPGLSAYAISKLAAQRYIESLDAEYPKLGAFTIMPGVVPTDMSAAFPIPKVTDKAEQTGAWALYLASGRGDYLKGSMANVHWDPEEMEEYKEEIKTNRLLRIKYSPIFGLEGGNGLQGLRK